MRYLITGGAGFIGSHLSRELLSRGDSVHIIDDLSTGSIDNIAALKSDSRFSYTIESAHQSSVVAELVDAADAVFHLAAAVGVELIVESPVRTIETNIHVTEIVLTHAAKKRRPVFIASTSEVYGKSPDLPFREAGDFVLGAPVKARWAYACSKALDEFLALAYWKEQRLPAVVGRLFNTVGPGQTGRYGMVIPNLVRQALAEQPMTVFGDGTQQRCFCHVRDVCRGLADLIGEERAYGEAFNIGSVEEISILELAERIREQVGSSSEITLVPYDVAYEEGFEDMKRRVPDLTKVKDMIGWSPQEDLTSILADVIEHQRETGST